MRHPLNPIHGIILRRLSAAWIVMSLLFGGIAYVVELEKIDGYVVALATAEAERFNAIDIPLAAAPETAASASLLEKARALARERFVVVEIRDREHRPLVQASNPRYAALERELATQGHHFPDDDRLHYWRTTLLDSTLIQIRVPLHAAQDGINGYFNGVFVVDPATLAQLRSDLVHALAITLFAVLLTTMALYPVILSLNRKVLEFSREVVKGNLEMASVLGAAIAKRDSETNAHNYRVTLYSIALGEAEGIDMASMRALILGAFLHDVGKIGISDNILLKPDRLTEAEFAIMRTHVALGVEILHDSEWLQAALEVVGNHHEKFDGSGYPHGLAGDAIPRNARIFAIVDVFDALASARPYKMAMSCEAALVMLREGSGSHFDPRLLARFCTLAPELHRRYADAAETHLSHWLREKGLHYFFAAAALKPE